MWSTLPNAFERSINEPVVYLFTMKSFVTSSASSIAWGLQPYLKRDSDTGVCPWFFQNFQEHLFYRTPLDDCFWPYMFVYVFLS